MPMTHVSRILREGPGRILTESPGNRTLALIFGLASFLLANLFVRLTALRHALGLGPGKVGLALIGLSTGSILAMPTSGRIVHRPWPGRSPASRDRMAASRRWR